MYSYLKLYKKSNIKYTISLFIFIFIPITNNFQIFYSYFILNCHIFKFQIKPYYLFPFLKFKQRLLYLKGLLFPSSHFSTFTLEIKINLNSKSVPLTYGICFLHTPSS